MRFSGNRDECERWAFRMKFSWKCIKILTLKKQYNFTKSSCPVWGFPEIGTNASVRRFAWKFHESLTIFIKFLLKNPWILPIWAKKIAREVFIKTALKWGPLFFSEKKWVPFSPTGRPKISEAPLLLIFRGSFSAVWTAENEYRKVRILIVLCELSALPIFGNPHTGKPLFVKFWCLSKVRILIVLCELSVPPYFRKSSYGKAAFCKILMLV